MKLDQFTEAYIECAMWASTDEGGTPLDCIDAELSPETREKMVADCEHFQGAFSELLAQWYELSESPDRAGHDFWLTRNGHGAGFWDRYSSGTPAGELARKLTDAAHAYGEVDLYVGEDEQIHG